MASPKLTSLSAFMPCYNEAKNIHHATQVLLKILPQVALKYQIIIINDGSTDSTGEKADALAQKNSHISVIHHSKNQGYGMSLRSGFHAALYDWTFFTDGDLQFNVDELQSFIPYTEKYNVIIGYRHKRAEGGQRALFALLWKLFIDILFRLHVKDIDCAFKLIKTQYIKQIDFVSTGALISAELLYRLKKMGLPFKQIPVTHYPRRFGTPTGNHPKVIVKAGIEAITMYLKLKFGRIL